MNEKPAKLTVRHHPTLGIYVAGLTTNAVSSYQEVQSILDFGTKARSVASTNMNSASSRSHCIFTFNLLKSGGGREQRASVNLVDLAGSERQKKTGTSGSQLKEGAMINQSLSNLALVINKLASFDDGKTDFVPFRNSKLTYILQESLSGNSKTVLIAALSPAFSNLEETLGTLKFAQTCKKVATKAVRNEANSGSIVEDLTAEITRLKEQLKASQATPENSKLQQQLQDTEQLLAQMEQDYQVQLAEAKKLEESRKKALGDLGLDLAEISGAVGMA
ncbi:Kinesin-like protein KIF13B (Kinesin-like protein GAKIN) [Durusdinium trenchii]|uniref:Kinesin-like protein n=1 Tax=Durusdinium trenchii TaxID=1381693 RepID=A0ABP0L0G2_9DINO